VRRTLPDLAAEELQARLMIEEVCSPKPYFFVARMLQNAILASSTVEASVVVPE